MLLLNYFGNDTGKECVTLQYYFAGNEMTVFRYIILQVMVTVMGALFVSWGPWTAVTLAEYNGHYTPLAEMVRVFAHMLVLTNSVINPLIYVWHIAEFKRTLKRLFSCRPAAVAPMDF